MRIRQKQVNFNFQNVYVIGDPDAIRTRDPLIKSQLLYRLSYGISLAKTLTK